MSETNKKIIQVTLSIGADSDLSQDKIEALLDELQNGMSELKAGPVDIISNKASDGGRAKDPAFITIAVALIQFVVPKLVDVIYEMIKQHRDNQVKVYANVGGEQIRMDAQTGPIEFEEIKGRLQAAIAAEEIPDRKYALLIGTTSYQDTRLNQLASPEIDIQALADVLRDPNIGGYDDVELLLNQSSLFILQAVEKFFKRKVNTDLLLLYFSGHGIRGEDDSLYLAAENTNLDLLRATTLTSGFIMTEMDRSKSERQILIMDCCYSGLFVHGTKAAEIGVPVNAANAFKGNGYGRVILTATDRTQVAWEGRNVTGAVQQSVFTHHLVEGLKTGAADNDRDGWIGLEELYKYIYSRMVVSTKDQTPEMNAFNMKGTIFLARNPKPKPKDLHEDLQALIESDLPAGREAAVGELIKLLKSDDYGMALAARKALEILAKDDSRRVSDAASKALGLKPFDTSPTSPPTPSIEPERGNSPQLPTAPALEPGDTQVPWWTAMKPLPGTRAHEGTKSGPILTDDNPLAPVNTAVIGPAYTDYTLTQSATTSTTKAKQTLIGRVIDSLRPIENLALFTGILSLILFFLPVSPLGIIVSIRAIKSTSRTSRAYTGLILSGVALAIQLTLVGIYL